MAATVGDWQVSEACFLSRDRGGTEEQTPPLYFNSTSSVPTTPLDFVLACASESVRVKKQAQSAGPDACQVRLCIAGQAAVALLVEPIHEHYPYEVLRT